MAADQDRPPGPAGVLPARSRNLCAPAGEGPGLIRPQTKIAVLTRHSHTDLFRRARRARLNGFILKEDSPEELGYAIRTILRGGFYTPPSMSTEIMTGGEPADPIESLTPREKSELILCAQGYTMKEIANALNISVKTAETHRNNIGRKLGHPNRAQLTAFALSHHLVDPSGQVGLWLGAAQAHTYRSKTNPTLPCLTGQSFRSNEYMSMEFPDFLSLSPYQRRAWAECLGRVIADIRERRGLSAAEAARLAGMETAQWDTIEDGKPTLGTPEQFQAMAETLGVDWGVVRMLVHLLCMPFRAPQRAIRAAGRPYS